MKANEKTNVMRTLEQHKMAYTGHYYEADSTLTGVEIAERLGEPQECVFKTLVTSGKPGKYYVFVIPVAAELNLKKAAAAAGEKAISMIPQKQLLPLTGYIHGGCSPVNMKKAFPTFLDRSAEGMGKIFVSAGKVGAQVEMDPKDISGLCPLETADLIV